MTINTIYHGYTGFFSTLLTNFFYFPNKNIVKKQKIYIANFLIIF